jgi:hypothetical protein
MAVATGTCCACGYEPLAFDAKNCPRCEARDPNPGVANRYANRGTVICLVIGLVIGVVWGYVGFQMGWAGAVGGALLGALAGVVIGLPGSLIVATIARLRGVR